MEDLWLTWAKRLQAIASTGLHYTEGSYDRERYAEVAAIAQHMIAALADVPPRRIAELVPQFAKGYATPLIEVRAAVFEHERLLLVRETSDGLWTLPGGFADVGLSARENAVKEVFEEAALRVEARALYAVLHKAKHPYDPDTRDFYKLFFLCERLNDEAPRPGHETSEVGYFEAGRLPPLSRGRTLERDIDAAFAFRADPAQPCRFD
ncbi:MAG: NUDIX hydrolase [Gammaproteobacteria bacterium]|nr:NUDIX hydrolase [Gammaproteobacteria bacterium]